MVYTPRQMKLKRKRDSLFILHNE